MGGGVAAYRPYTSYPTSFCGRNFVPKCFEAPTFFNARPCTFNFTCRWISHHDQVAVQLGLGVDLPDVPGQVEDVHRFPFDGCVHDGEVGTFEAVSQLGAVVRGQGLRVTYLLEK